MSDLRRHNDLLRFAYTENEVERIERIKEGNDELEKKLEQKRIEWNDKIKPLFTSLNKNFKLEKADIIIDIQSKHLSYKQIIIEEISVLLNNRTKIEVILRRLKQEKHALFSTASTIKLNASEKIMMIEGNLSENIRRLEIFDIHIEFLRASQKNLETLGYTVKNIIELHNYLGGR